MSQAPAKSRACPNCQAALPPNARACGVCKMEVAKMAAYAAAKKSAMTRGIKRPEVVTKAPPLIGAGMIVKFVLLFLVIGGLAWGAVALFKPKPPRYLQYPATAQDAAKEFLTHISAGGDTDYDQAYRMIADAVRDPRADDEIGNYRQIFHVMNRYLSREFGDNWITVTQVGPDAADPHVVVAHVGLETLHIRVADQTPPEKKTLGPHFGVLGVDEFDVNDAAKFRQLAAIGGVLKGMAGQGAVDNLATVLGAGGAPRHETPMQKKVRLLPVVGNPREASSYAVLGLWPIRQDPVVRNRLSMILNDGRYERDIQERADAILKEKVTEEDLAAAHVE